MKPKYHHSQQLYHGQRFDVLSVEVDSPKGKFSRELVDHPGAVVILPIINDNTVVLIRNYRFTMDEILLELPAGTLEQNEDPLKCAYRELEEETGYRAKTMNELFKFIPTPGFCNEVLHAYVAKDLTLFGQNLDPTEQIDVETFSFSQVLDAIKNGIIKDAKTIATLLYYHQFIRTQK